MASYQSMWADVFSLKCQWFAGSLLSLVCRPAAGEMARAKVLAFTVFLFLTVHGNAVGKSVCMSE